MSNKYLEAYLKSLDSRRSKASVVKISDLCEKNSLFETLFSNLKAAPSRRRGSISWVLAHSFKNKSWEPNSMQLDFLLGLLLKESEDMMCKRCLLDLFQYAPIMEEQMSPLVDECIRSIRSQKEPLAIRCFAITVLGRVMESYPELFNEVEQVLKDILDKGEPSLKVRARKVMESMN